MDMKGKDKKAALNNVFASIQQLQREAEDHLKLIEMKGRAHPMMLELSKSTKILPACPVCNGVGQKVRQVTVKHQVLPETEIEGDQFFLCRTPECEVAYYSEDGKITINQAQLIKKIWFKNVPPPVPICYCANVSEEEILHHVAVAQCCSTLDDIKRHTGANSGCECLTKNPAGG